MGHDSSVIAAASGFPLVRPKRVGAMSAGGERPVFFDETGRRARLVSGVGRLLGVATAAWFVAIVLGASGPVGLPSLQSELASARHGGTGAATVAHVAAGPSLRTTRAVADLKDAKPQRPAGRDIEARIDRRA